MLIEIEFNSKVPIYLQIRNKIVEAIAKGQIKDGDSLPSVRQMSGMIDVNLHTINKAYNLLKSEGYLQVDKRVGVIVKINKPNNFIDEFNEKINLILAEGKVMGLKEEEIIKVVKEKYNKFKVGD